MCRRIKPANNGLPNSFSAICTKLSHLLSDLHRHTLRTVNTHFKFFAISISWAKRTYFFSLWILHLFTPSSQMAKVFLPSNIFFDLRTVKGLSSETLLRLAELVLTFNCFSFADSYFKQINGLAIGATSYPNLFAGDIEQQFFNQYNGPKPELYRRYIDDCISATSSTRRSRRAREPSSIFHKYWAISSGEQPNMLRVKESPTLKLWGVSPLHRL